MAISPEQLEKEIFVTPEQKRQRIFMAIFLVVFFITVVFLYFNFVKKRLLEAEMPFFEGAPKLIESLRQARLDIKILEAEDFLNLKLYGQLPVKVEDKGRNNPFLPF